MIKYLDKYLLRRTIALLPLGITVLIFLTREKFEAYQSNPYAYFGRFQIFLWLKM